MKQIANWFKQLGRSEYGDHAPPVPRITLFSLGLN